MTIRKDKWGVLRKQKRVVNVVKGQLNGEIKLEGKVCRKVRKQVKNEYKWQK